MKEDLSKNVINRKKNFLKIYLKSYDRLPHMRKTYLLVTAFYNEPSSNLQISYTWFGQVIYYELEIKK